MPSSSSSHSRSGLAAQLDMGDVHVCNICLKQFRRGDLRNRHRRRCEKSIGKIMPTKKRSCERCISFKVKCDHEKPSCGRCLGRSVPCEYKLEPKVKMPLGLAFGLGPNAAFNGSMDGPLQRLEVHGRDEHLLSVASPEIMFDMSSSSGALADRTLGALDATMDLVGQGFYANEYYQHWGQVGTAWAEGMMPDDWAMESIF
ncbi:fungal zn(2)-Cys(6) binuclear cluster domain-containing protein [Pochonia chlamydosporia 170]|uniref:Fungal zn(2)-Cys(6) binuclear cluster domain-containing protein n=1 Tax=Pochonia chlamydosporia 170 TaxID=1380566 RepID=A0A179F0X4_METCM|nr:fungal zn(2)-Cys(6) binuclear cluster domain-containing protein [Pochonia chlamydosporia 170]OAQ59104.1 fungal zn(2)-Cys(6) binuclear cluster domain-containing protein [Pochonia chlamydosporia 170]